MSDLIVEPVNFSTDAESTLNNTHVALPALVDLPYCQICCGSGTGSDGSSQRIVPAGAAGVGCVE